MLYTKSTYTFYQFANGRQYYKMVSNWRDTISGEKIFDLIEEKRWVETF